MEIKDNSSAEKTHFTDFYNGLDVFSKKIVDMMIHVQDMDKPMRDSVSSYMNFPCLSLSSKFEYWGFKHNGKGGWDCEWNLNTKTHCVLIDCAGVVRLYSASSEFSNGISVFVKDENDMHELFSYIGHEYDYGHIVDE